MAERARLTRRPGWRALVLLASAVVALHAFTLDWLARELRYSTVLRPTVDPMFTRLLKPQAPPSVPVAAAVPKPAAAMPARDNNAFAAAVKPRKPAASEPTQEQRQMADAQPPQPQQAPQAPATTEPQPPAVQPPAAQAEAAAPPASAPASSDAQALDSWPADTRLSYVLSGRFRSGELFGDARVQWQRDGSAYQVRVAVDVAVWASLVLTSQGEVTPAGLAPRAYEEVRNGKPRAVRLDRSTVLVEGGRVLPRPEGVQDTASQFVELGHRFATGGTQLQVGQAVSFWMARPGGVDLWTYDVVGREVLQTPQLGALDTFHLRPRPIANPRGNITAEMWFAPGLQYLPVRIRVNMDDMAYVDLLVERIEQR
ncbi:DUF3108 domain-containing protein [Ramlibacter sp.]|uniref:DUF3108 domain-containing protein n=1 Tax=Ramlibacter sp. TaxID=1917967 RepID=UPI001822FA9E|nr:DUF3108 domain-containing protein [Ramlibacter sp.]MBA2674887.1 DUF3108 domain-containing protein [Ramlibacter sp.]